MYESLSEFMFVRACAWAACGMGSRDNNLRAGWAALRIALGITNKDDVVTVIPSLSSYLHHLISQHHTPSALGIAIRGAWGTHKWGWSW